MIRGRGNEIFKGNIVRTRFPARVDESFVIRYDTSGFRAAFQMYSKVLFVLKIQFGCTESIESKKVMNFKASLQLEAVVMFPLRKAANFKIFLT